MSKSKRNKHLEGAYPDLIYQQKEVAAYEVLKPERNVLCNNTLPSLINQLYKN